MRKIILILLFISVGIILHGQSLINLKSLSIKPSADTIILDTLSVSESSISFYDTKNNPIKGIKYSFDFEKSAIYFDTIPNIDTIIIKYKTFPINFFEPYRLFSKDKFLKAKDSSDNEKYDYVFTPSDYRPRFYQSGLSRKGSISRGISFGNAQDVIVNSNLNLQLEGRLNNELNINAAVSDNNIPIQPDGTSQQLQDFDKVFIKLYNDKLSIIAGDFELKKPKGYFLNYYKQAQGANIMYQTAFENKNKKEVVVKTSVSGAISKGKLRRQEIAGIEGNQGPYKLTGKNNETFIIVLAGTEKVYIDGMLMKRGTENDYVIDYNLGEIVFTANQPINKDKRIIVEFEYSDRNYTRFLVTSSNNISVGNFDFRLNIYDETDNKNQAFDQTITSEDRNLLSQIGDNPDLAVTPGYDSIPYQAGEIRYELKDTTVETITYDSIFVYSNNPDKAYYRISFSYVGANKGDYIKNVTATNGRVYEWVAPVNGVPQGDYIPQKKIITPEKNQVVSIGSAIKISDKSNVDIELAYSKNDKNTFSKIDSEDDQSYAAKINFVQHIIKNNKSNLSANLSYGFINKDFKAIENFRETEFTRNWNISSIYPQKNENLIDFGVIYNHNKIGNTKFNTSYINRGVEYTGVQNIATADFSVKGWTLKGRAGYLNSKNQLFNTAFLRHNILLSKNIGVFTIGVKEKSENNIWKSAITDSLGLNSFNFNQYEAFVNTDDSAKNNMFLKYKYREDKLPLNNNLSSSTIAHDAGFGARFNIKSNHKFKTVFNFRNLQIVDTSLYAGKSENNLTGKTEYSFQALKGLISYSTLYEIGSGLERKKEFSYIEVAAGQGVYVWKDYNGNNIQELDEFEVEDFSDEGNFIRVLIPTNDYIKTYSNQFNQSLKLTPRRAFKSNAGIVKFINRFSDQLAYRVSQKNTSSNIWEFANPFNSNIEETKLVTMASSFRNNFSFNKGKPKFGIDYIIQSNNNKILLVSGFDYRASFGHSLLIRYNIGSFINITNDFGKGDKTYKSEFFSNKDYKIEYLSNESKVSLQPNNSNRITLKYLYKIKENIIGVEKLFINDIGVEYRLSSVKKGSLSANFNYIYYKYNAETNTAVSYEMLQGFMPGSNITWSINFQRQLSNGLQVNLNYNARKSEDTKIIHTGGVQLRAFF